MNQTSILIPFLMQIGLTLIMFILLAIRKSNAIKTSTIDRKKAALDNSAWTTEVVQVSNNIANQFQTPVLFYALALFFYASEQVTFLITILAWLYVVSRYVHAVVHVTSNFIPVRLASFTFGMLCLISMTVVAAINVTL
ncbi:MAG: MAPEG family protein [Kangiellaceae bacterium]|nr:MAPEG family protein [Kangiellaceae bacterium]